MELGRKGVFPIILIIETKSGSLKLVLFYSHLEENFDLKIKGMPARLIPFAKENAGAKKRKSHFIQTLLPFSPACFVH